MIGPLIGFFLPVEHYSSFPLASKLGSDFLPGTQYSDLPPVVSLYLVISFVPVLFTSVLPFFVMSHTPTTYLIGCTECRGFYAYPTVWLLSSGIMQQLTMLMNLPSTS